MVNPLFNPGDRVFHKGKSTYGVIQKLINANDVADVLAQGVRYELLHSGCIWSVPESSLRTPDKEPHSHLNRDKLPCT